MGIKFSKKRDASINSAEAAEEPTVAQPEEPENQPDTTLEHDADDKQDLDVVVMEPASPVASLPKEDCVWESKEVKEGEEAAAEPPVPEPDPATGAQACSPKPESAINPVAFPVDQEPPSEAQGHKDTVTLETIPDPIMSSPTLDEMGDPAPGPDPSPASVNPDDEFHDKCEVPAEPLGELMDAALAGRSQEVRNDVDEGGVDKLMENLELTGSDLNADIIPADTDIHGDTPEMSTWAGVKTPLSFCYEYFFMFRTCFIGKWSFLFHKSHKPKSMTFKQMV